MPNTPNTSAKRALIIGIDKYQFAPKIPQLHGCVNDARLMRAILEEQFGFPADGITFITDEQATRDGILLALDALVAATGQDDIVVIYYAGHGSQMTDREGDEASGLDNTLMSVDSEGWSGLNRDITDDEIHLRLVALGEKTSYISMIVDACHSATITRDAFGVMSRGVPADTRPVSELPPSPIPASTTRGASSASSASQERGPSGWMPLADQYVLIAGCRDEETSFEYRPPEGEGKLVHGALTYFLSQELRRATAGTSYRDVFERAAAKVTANNARQHPQMEGRVDRALFGVTDLEPMRFARILSRTGDTVTLAAGAAHGMTVGSVWAVYSQGTKHTEGVAELGTVEITNVRAVRADARVVAEAMPGAIAVDGRAVEREHSYGTLRLRVQLAPDVAAAEERGVAQAKALREALAESKLVQVVDASDSAAAARVYLIEPRAAAGPEDPVPQLGAVTSATWAVVNTAGELQMPAKSLTEYLEVRDNLETLARCRQALELENPSPNSALRGKFELHLLRRAADGKWVIAEPEGAGGLPVFEEGDDIAFEIKSRHDARAYVSLVDFSPSGKVSLIFPAPGATDQITPGVRFQIGTRAGVDDFAVSFPDGYPYSGDGAKAPTDAVETVKLFVTTTEADFGFLEQEGVRSVGRPSNPLQLLWETAAGGGGGVRDIKRKTLPVDNEDWTTVVRPFIVRRKSSVALSGAGEPVSLGSATLRAPGLAGAAAALGWETGRAAAAGLASGDLAAALANEGAQIRETIAVSDARPTDGGRGAAPTMELEVADAGPDFGQMLVHTDELGVVTWHFADAEARPGSRSAGGVAGGATRTFRIPATGATAAANDPGSRGVVGALASAATKQFLKVVVFPLVEPAIGAIAADYANRWEGKRRPYRVRSFTPDDYTQPDGAEVTGDDWRRFSEGRALLMVHGTFSRAHAAFGGLPKEFVTGLHERYGGRVFAFDHFTLSHDPKRNVAELMSRLPEDASLDVDILCHSRGGLVSRLLAERQSELSLGSRTVRVGKVIFAGTPNAGTTLADTKHMGDFIDTYTTMMNLIPSAGVAEVLAGVVTVAKMLAVGAAKGLVGLQSMQPGGEFAKWLNSGTRGGETRYFALSSNFEPGEPGLRALVKNRLMDKVFGGSNDLVVPTAGVYDQNGSGWFPIEDRLVFQGSDAVPHTGFFASAAARGKIMEWLRA